MRESIIYSGVNKKEANFPLGIIKEFKKGQFVYHEQDRAFKLYKLKEGLLMMGSSLSSAKTNFTHFVQEGEFFGEEVLLDIQARGNSAQVLTNTVQVEEYSMNLLVDSADTQKIVRDNFVNHSTRVQHTLLRNCGMNLRSRLVSVLKEVGNGVGVTLVNGEQLIRTHLKHRELAFLCNATRQSITTQLIELSRAKYINIDKNSILLTNQLLTNF
ncbi:MAG: CRP/FNR family cyclic AMP-dependent transcriptional regulator [Glaciecola sp.]|jgi:CRP/FNR family cyclic AMP-dependent transcriptional regulator